MVRWLKRILRLLFRGNRSYRKIMKFLTIYGLLSTPINYAMTALQTHTNLNDVTRVVQTMKEGGWSNQLTMGLWQPVKNFAKIGYSKALETMGGNDNLAKAKELQQQAEGWFNKGKDTLTSLTKPSETSSMTDEWSYDLYPDYYRVVGPSNLNPADFGEGISYQGLDSNSNDVNKKRTLGAGGKITWSMVNNAKGNRLPWESDSEPSGWPSISGFKNLKVNIPESTGKGYNGYFYNKSHLIANQLGGAATRENVITGTRSQNVGQRNQQGGMRYSEKKAVDYILQDTSHFMYYYATPIYNDDEIVPRMVVVQMLSDDGSIDETVEVFNTANGWDIDYHTGQYFKK